MISLIVALSPDSDAGLAPFRSVVGGGRSEETPRRRPSRGLGRLAFTATTRFLSAGRRQGRRPDDRARRPLVVDPRPLSCRLRCHWPPSTRDTSTGVLAHPFVTLVWSLGLLLVGQSGLYPRLGIELVPELIQGEFYVDIELPPGTHLDVTDRAWRRLESRTADTIPGRRRSTPSPVHRTNRAVSPRGAAREHRPDHRDPRPTDLARTRTRRSTAHGGDADIGRSRMGAEGMKRSPAVARFGRPSYFSFRTPIEVEIRGFNLTLLERLADEAVRADARGSKV